MSNAFKKTLVSQPLRGCIDSTDLFLEWSEVPWDTAIFGTPVLQINGLEVRGANARETMADFECARDACRSGLVSCRLSHHLLRESMLLEDVGFRFIEMVYQPEINLYGSSEFHDTGHLTALLATEADLPEVLAVAGSAFRNERFHVDPRLSVECANERYRNWARSSLSHPTQRLCVLRANSALLAFFVTEALPDGTCYWHLNAVSPEFQGKGYGRLAWRTMLEQARREGMVRVRTSIVARNHRVLNLYASLGFSFAAPAMTFHWVRAK